MIEINLLPDEMKKSQKRFKGVDLSAVPLPNISTLGLAAGLIVLLLSIHGVILGVGLYNRGLFDLLSKKYNAILATKKEVDSLKAQANSINNKVNAVNELMVKRFSWARKLNSLSDSVTPGVWLSDLSYDEKIIEKFVPSAQNTALSGKDKAGAARRTVEKTVFRYLVLSGYASSMGEQGTALVAKFIKSLKENSEFYSHFSEIELDSIKSDKVQAQEVMSFKITCLFKEM